MAGESKYNTYSAAISDVKNRIIPEGKQYVDKTLADRKMYKKSISDAKEAETKALTQMEAAQDLYEDYQQRIYEASNDEDGNEDISYLQNQAYLARLAYDQNREEFNNAQKELARAQEGLQQLQEMAQKLQQTLNRLIQYCNTINQGIQQEMCNRKVSKPQFDRAAQTKFGNSAFRQSLELSPEIKEYGELIHNCNECIKEIKKFISALDEEGEEREREKVLTR